MLLVPRLRRLRDRLESPKYQAHSVSKHPKRAPHRIIQEMYVQITLLHMVAEPVVLNRPWLPLDTEDLAR